MLPCGGSLTANATPEGNIRCLAMAALVLLAGHPARAADVTALRSTLEQSAVAQRHWANTWGTIWTVTILGQGIAMPLVRDTETRVDLGFGAASAALGLIPTWIRPPRAVTLWHEGQVAGKDRDEEWLRQALEEDREDKASRRGWIAHGSNVAVNLALGAIQAFAIGHKGAALITTVVGIPIGAVMIETQPRATGEHNITATIAPTGHGAWAAVAIRF